ncbi:helix-turn-helix domain-containing protein [Solemya velum gill symbiont]|uniref:helix-turn-helix domain-containing protein n=1 Tax=Solemya velum gill symbiont TaxID=2340 RepID=UPI0009970AEB|nr:helix-turn-helix domain-containing protein [Solemya velum gill symbiont]
MALPEHLQVLQDPTLKQTSEILQVSPATVWRLCKKGILKKYKTGGCARINRESIEALRNSAA